MKGDFTRMTFDSRRHYWGVLRQQGRVDLDADWNEQVRIARHHRERRTADLVGAEGGPAEAAGFELGADGSGAVTIGPGRYYVAGILCENESPVDLTAQDDSPGSIDLPSTAGLHLAFLDVWDRHTSALDDPRIRETALGGPDTATRARTVWQVKTTPAAMVPPALATAVAALAAARAAEDAAAEAAALQQIRELAHGAYCDDAFSFDPEAGSLEAGTGTLAARAAEADPGSNLCRFEPGGGYRRQENRLYRVEIHGPGDEENATFKWSRDNGAVVVPIEEYVLAHAGDTVTDRVRVHRLGLDSTQELRQHDWVEIVSDDDELAGLPGTLVQITEPPDSEERILVLSGNVADKAFGLHPKVRRWDMPADAGLIDVDVTAPIPLGDDGIEVEFGAGTFHTGDYWLIPARAHTADVEWPPYPTYPGEVVSADPEHLPPMGIEHRRAPLAILVHDGSDVVAAVDLRRLFPAATDLTTLSYAGGDGQEPVLPGGALPRPIQVAVSNGAEPVEGVLVRFEVLEGGGQLDAGGGPGSEVIVASGADGLASVDWTLDTSEIDHRVEARLLDRCGESTSHVPVFFNSHVNYQLHYLSGDGQECMPGETLEPLRVWVSDGRWPLPGAVVEFTVTAGAGALGAVAPSDADGVVECVWTPDEVTPRQQVQARLLDAGGGAVHNAAVRFNANLSLASQVAYEPTGDCPALAEAETVQEALDELCRRTGCCTVVVDPGEDIQTALGLLPDEGGCVCLKTGLHEIDGPILIDQSNVVLHGESPGALVRGHGELFEILGSTAEPVENVTVEGIRFEMEEQSTPDFLLTIADTRGVRLRNCHLQVSSGVGTVGIFAGMTEGLEISGNEFHGFTVAVMGLTGVSRIEIRDNLFAGPRVEDLLSGEVAVSLVTFYGAGHRVEGNHISDYRSGVILGDPAIPGDEDSRIAGNVILRQGAVEPADDLLYAIDVAAPRCLVRDNRIEIPTYACGGIRATAATATVEKNRVDSTAEAFNDELPVGICLEAPAESVKSPDDGAVCHNQLTGLQDAIMVAGADGAPVTGVRVHGNRIEGTNSSERPIAVSLESCEKGVIEDNEIRAVGSGIVLADGVGNRVLDNSVTDGWKGIWIVGQEESLEVCGNTVEHMRHSGFGATELLGVTTLAHCRFSNCSYEGISDAVAVAVGVEGDFEYSEWIVDSCQILDTGFDREGVRKAPVAIGLAGVMIFSCQIHGNLIKVESADEFYFFDRSLFLFGWPALDYSANDKFHLAIAFGSAQITDNKLIGPGFPWLVDVGFYLRFERFGLGWTFEKTIFSDNEVQHATSVLALLLENLLDEEAAEGSDLSIVRPWLETYRGASVRFGLWHGVVQGNQVRASLRGWPTIGHILLKDQSYSLFSFSYPSMNFTDVGKVALLGNVTTGPLINIATATPGDVYEFNSIWN